MNITDAMVEAAARAVWGVDMAPSTWDEVSEANRERWLHDARVALKAALAVADEEAA